MKKKRAKSSRRGVSTEQILQEATVLRKAMHHGVIYLHEVFETSAEFTLVLELWVFEILEMSLHIRLGSLRHFNVITASRVISSAPSYVSVGVSECRSVDLTN